MTNAYLQIAAEVLMNERRPLSPRVIIAEAYKSGIVPTNLHGKTQHKTLGARISEDIISKRERSRFFRTSPGKYFLRDFLDDPGIPEDFRRPFYARRRLRDLVRGPTLAINSTQIVQLAGTNLVIEPAKVLRMLARGVHAYINSKKEHEGFYLVRPFVCVFRGAHVLTFRAGRYRDDRDNFFAKRSIGFSTLVTPHDQTLFNAKDAGVVEAGVRATMIDLDLMSGKENCEQLTRKAELYRFVVSHETMSTGDLLAVVSIQCPAWFEPSRRRLALNDLEWMDIRNHVNNIDDFDPWSRLVLKAFYAGNHAFGRKF